jgi:hypothetical protein
MSNVLGSGLRTRVWWTSDLSARIAAALTSFIGRPNSSSWLPTAFMTTAISRGSIPNRCSTARAIIAAETPCASRETQLPMSCMNPAIDASSALRSS